MTINCGGKVLDLSKPKVMAICNITGDSFFKESRVASEKELITMAGQHLSDGADIIDIGGMSSRPGAKEIPLKDEIVKLIWALKILRREFNNVLISIDTYRAEVVKSVTEYGINMVNDISGGSIDPDILPTVGALNLPYVLMHMKGTPRHMQQNPSYKSNVVMAELEYFKTSLHRCKNEGIVDVIIDPGFGFGKTIDDNYKLLYQLKAFQLFDVPIMVGLSRKSMIYKVLGIDPAAALNGTTALHMHALLSGAKILRVHDTRAAHDCIVLHQKLESVNQ
ncbi:MAG: dihydropteroate synthase [Saprospiraceae bacterium]